jgi:hypothetical protein
MGRASWRITLGAALGVLLMAAGLRGQSTSKTETKAFEVIAVDGNQLVVRTGGATKEYSVPEDFRFHVGNRQLSVHELEPGMKGTATITTITTVTPVSVTEVKDGTVMQVMGNSVIVRGENGMKMFSEGDLAKRHITIVRGGQPVQITDLHAGDRLSATIITEQPPKVMTEQQVEASIQAAASKPAPAPPAGEAPAAAQAAPAAPVPAPSATTPPLQVPAERHSSSLGLLGMLAALVVVVLAIAVWRKGRVSG